MNEYERIAVEHPRDNVTLIRLSDRSLTKPLLLDQLQTELRECIDSQPSCLVIVDFTHVSFLATVALNCILSARMFLKEHGGDMKLCGMSENIRGVFRRTHLEGTIFTICDTLDDALQ